MSRSVCLFNGGSAVHPEQVRAGVNPSRVYLEEPSLDSITGLPTIVEIDLTPQPVTANATYAIWRITKLPPFVSYTIGAEIDGVKVTRGLLTSAFEFGQCQL
jgi:hypothetical protein